MKLRILGCSGGVGGDLRTTSLLIDNDILIDAGSGVGELTLEEMHHIRHVFLTHSHLDHFSFLPLLVDSIFPSIREPLIVHGQPETLEALQKHVFNWTIWPDFAKLPTEEDPVMKGTSWPTMIEASSIGIDSLREQMDTLLRSRLERTI